MALYLPIRALNRSSQIRIDGQKVTPDTAVYIDISKVSVRRDFAHHTTFGQVYAVGPVGTSNSDVVVEWGATTDEGTANNDMVIRTYVGLLHNRQTGANVDVAQTDVTIATAHATLVRIDIVQVNTTTGVVTKKDGTAAASPVAPSPDAGNITIASVNVPATDTAITTNQITDVRPRP